MASRVRRRGARRRGIEPSSYIAAPVEPDLEALGVQLDVHGQELADALGREGRAVVRDPAEEELLDPATEAGRAVRLAVLGAAEGHELVHLPAQVVRHPGDLDDP